MSFLPFTFFLTLGLFPRSVLSAVQVQLLGGHGTAQQTAIAAWSRSSGDPLIASIAKVKLDTDNDKPLTSDPVSITVDSDHTSGTVTLSFNRAGIFHLIALNSQSSAIATGSEFGVNAPESLQFAAQVSTTTAIHGSSTEIALLGPSDSSTRTSSTISATTSPPTTTATNSNSSSNYETVVSSPSKTAIIISSVLASIFFLLFIALLYYALLRRRTTRKSQTFRGELMSRHPRRLTSFVNRYFNEDGRRVGSERFPEYKPPVPEKDFPVRTLTDLNISRFVLPYSYGVANSDKKQVKSKLPRLPSMATTIATMTDLTSDSSCYTNLNHYTFAPLTDRQMELVQTIQDLQAELIGLNRLEENSRASSAFTLPGENDLRMVKLTGRIERLEKLMSSRWALGLTDDVPREYF